MSIDSRHEDGSAGSVAIAAYIEAEECGAAPDREEFVRLYPEDETQLRKYWAGLDSFRAKADIPGLTTPGADADNSELQPTLPAPSDVGDTVAASARYRDLQFFKKGGLGTLYRAVDESLHRDTIVKFVSDKCSDDPVLVTQFRVEAEITARLDHPGVVPVYAIGDTWNNKPFYVMRLIKGRELSLAIQEYHAAEAADSRRASSRQHLYALLEHLVSACNTVAFAHDVGIIHCDIKPSNIMIGRYGETIVLDWGLAASFERTTNFYSSEPTMRPRSASGSSASGQRGGTYGYVSPEQLSPDQSIGPTSDVYSLGATLYEILTGAPPFNGRDKDVIERIRTGRFRLPRELKKDIPWRLAAICRKAMRLRPEERYATAKQLAADLTNWMRDEEVQAAPDRWTDRLARISRRHRSLTAVTLVCAIVLAASAAWIDRTRKLAEHEQELRQAQNAQSELVEMNFTTALETFEDLCRPLANGEMNNLGVYRPFADRIERFTNVYLEKFENTDSMAVHTGRVYELWAIVSCVLTSDTSQALRHYQKAEAIYQGRTPDDESKAIELKRRLAHIHLSLGRLHILRQEFGPADDMLAQAREALEKQSGERPDDRGLRRDLAEVYHSLGEVFLERNGDGRTRHQALLDSRTHFETSRDLRQELMESARGSERSNCERDLARSLGYLGDLCLAQGKVAEAVDNYNRSLDHRQELYNSNPNDPENRFQLARGLGNFGNLERDYQGNLGNAIEKFEAARLIQKKLADDFSEVAAFRRDYGTTLNALAEVYLLEATRDPEKRAVYTKLAVEMAQQASETYGEIIRQSDNQSDSKGVHRLAQSYVTLALLEQLNHGNETVRFAGDAEELLLKHLGREPMLGRSQLVTLAMCRSLQGHPKAALQNLKNAVERGENTVNRFERHRAAGFQAIAADPELGPRLDDLCREMRAKLRFE